MPETARNHFPAGCPAGGIPAVVLMYHQAEGVTVEYMLFICNDPTAPAYVAAEDNIAEWIAEMEARGVARHGDRLRPVDDATTVTVRAGNVVVSDGPFAETKEWIAGYDIIACADLDEAIEVASKHPMAKFGKIEIRPVWPLGE
jgi:hypothetical protein